MLNHVTSAHGNSPECSENSGSDSCGEDELELEDDKKSLINKSRTKYKLHGQMSELDCRVMFVTSV
jgi:hypothetical protein